MPKNLPSVQLSLNGEPIYLMGFTAGVKMVREEEDMSGQESSTAKSDKGVKAKELTVSGTIPYKRQEWLTKIFQLAEATDNKGEQVVYRIAALSAQAVNMREGVFSGEVSADEQNTQGWLVSFKLVERNSVAEKKAKGKEKPKSKTQSEKGKDKIKASKTKTKKGQSKKKGKSDSGGNGGFTVFLD